MTAEEIRKTWTEQKHGPDFHFDIKAQVMVEIAAQLAELNANLSKAANRSIFEQTFGR